MPDDDVIHRITEARPPLSEDIDGRTRRYLWSMGIRTGCFIAAIVTHGWLRWALIVGAVVLPYLAVVFANAGRESEEPGPGPVSPDLRSLRDGNNRTQ